MNIPGKRTEREQATRFGRSPRTLQLWRKLGLISYTKIGPTILYDDKDEAEFLKMREHRAVRGRRAQPTTASA